MIEWLRNTIINLLLDILCQIVPANKKSVYTLTIEPVDDGASMLAALREADEDQHA